MVFAYEFDERFPVAPNRVATGPNLLHGGFSRVSDNPIVIKHLKLQYSFNGGGKTYSVNIFVVGHILVSVPLGVAVFAKDFQNLSKKTLDISQRLMRLSYWLGCLKNVTFRC